MRWVWWVGSANRAEPVQIRERVLEEEERVGFQAAEISLARLTSVRGEEVLVVPRGAIRIAPYHDVGNAPRYAVPLDRPGELTGPPRRITERVLTGLGERRNLPARLRLRHDPRQLASQSDQLFS